MEVTTTDDHGKQYSDGEWHEIIAIRHQAFGHITLDGQYTGKYFYKYKQFYWYACISIFFSYLYHYIIIISIQIHLNCCRNFTLVAAEIMKSGSQFLTHAGLQ